jgi:hypothetical protein
MAEAKTIPAIKQPGKQPMGRPFVPGDPRINRNGRPTLDKSLTEQLRRDSSRRLPAVEELPPAWQRAWPYISAIWPHTRTILQLFSRKLWLDGIMGDNQARSIIYERLEGRVPQPEYVKVEGTVVTVTWRDIMKQQGGNVESEVDDDVQQSVEAMKQLTGGGNGGNGKGSKKR